MLNQMTKQVTKKIYSDSDSIEAANEAMKTFDH